MGPTNASKLHNGGQPVAAVPPSVPAPLPLSIDVAELMGHRREIELVHNGERYRLRRTRLDKLILTK